MKLKECAYLKLLINVECCALQEQESEALVQDVENGNAAKLNGTALNASAAEEATVKPAPGAGGPKFGWIKGVLVSRAAATEAHPVTDVLPTKKCAVYLLRDVKFSIFGVSSELSNKTL